MTKNVSPFKFLDSYQQEDADIYFGRERETRALYDALQGVKHLLVFGPSGSGKTSLIECGLRNQFSEAAWFALTIRRGKNIMQSVFADINEALEDKIALDPHNKLPREADFGFEHAVEKLFSERYQPIYLLFDQFEELLLLGSEAEKNEFFTAFDRLIRYKMPCRALLVMREEFIGHLSEFEPICPSIFQHRFRLEKMGRSNVQSVIQQILEAEKYQSDFRVEQPAALAKSILAKLPDTQREIELAHVQVFLGELWDRAVAGNKSQKPTLHSGLVKENDNLERVLDSFLKKQLEQLERSYGEKVPLELLAAMISERHTKLQLGAGDLENALAKNAIALQKPLPDLLRDFEQRRIIRTLKSGEQTQFEISHDVLALVVGQNLTDEMKLREKAREIYRVYEGKAGMFSREDLDYLRAFEGYLGMPEGLGRRIEESEAALVQREREAAEKVLERARELEAQAATERRRAEEAERLKNEAVNARQVAETEKRKAQKMMYWAIGLAGLASLATLGAGYMYFKSEKNREQSEVAKQTANQELLKALHEKGRRLNGEKAQLVRAQAVYKTANDSILIRETQRALVEKDSLIHLNQTVINQAKNTQNQ